jgi:hypothetical protein
MGSRLGNAVLLLSILVAGGWIWLNIYVGQEDMSIPLIIAAVIMLVGAGIRHVIGGAVKGYRSPSTWH